MPSTYSPNLRIELIGYGEQNNTWGTTTNTNLGTLIEQSIAGQAAVNVTAGDVTLTAVDGATDQARQMILGITGTPGTARNVIAPSVSKVYVVANGSNATVTVKTAAGTGVPVSAGKAKFVYCNGTDFYEATTEQASAVITNLTVSGNTILGDASADTVTINGTVQPGVVISGSSSSNALRITQTGLGNALVVEDDTNPDSSPFVVEATGDVLIGTATAIPGAFSDTGKLQIATNTGEATQHNYAFLSNPNGSIIYLNKSRSGTIGTNLKVLANDILGQIVFAGADDVSYTRGAAIIAEVDGTPGASDMPGRLVFSTTRDGSSSPSEAFRVNSLQNTLFGRTYSGSERIGIGGGTSAITTTTSAYGILNDTVVSSAQTNTYRANDTYLATQAAAFTLNNLRHYNAGLNSIGAGSSITNQYGFYADGSLVGATTANYGFYSGISASVGSTRYNFYAAGTADNYFGGPVQISTSSTSNALQITQTGTGPALLVNTSGTPNNSPFSVNANGQVGLGISPASIPSQASLYIASSDGVTNTEMDLFRAGNTVGGQSIQFIKSRGTVASPLVAANGDQLGNIFFRGRDDAGNNVLGAAIQAFVDGIVTGANDMPGRLVFSTTADGASAPTEAVRIDSAQNIGIGGASTAGYVITANKSITGNTNAVGVRFGGTIQSDVTSSVALFSTRPSTVAASFTLGSLFHYITDTQTLGAGSSITSQYGFFANATLTGATNNYGFYSNIPGAAGRWNIYIAGTADNFFQGPIKSNGIVAGGYFAHSAGTTAMLLGSYNVVKVTPNATATYTTTVAPAGSESSIIIVTSGTTSYTITFGTGFLTTGTLATGTVTAKTFVVNFVSDGTTMIETSRTVAM